MHKVVEYENLDGVAILTLNRPERINAFNVAMRDELFELLRLFNDDPDSSVAVIRGAGDQGFCAGADLTEFGTAPSQVIARSVRWERDIWGLFQSLKKPIISSLHGHVIGSGIEIAALTDIRVAATNCKFRMPEVALGMIPAAGGTQSISRLTSISIALDMLLTNRVLTAENARKIGLVDKVVSPNKLDFTSMELARLIKSFDPNVLYGLKRLVRSSTDLNLAAGLKFEKIVARSLVSLKA